MRELNIRHNIFILILIQCQYLCLTGYQPTTTKLIPIQIKVDPGKINHFLSSAFYKFTKIFPPSLKSFKVLNGA